MGRLLAIASTSWHRALRQPAYWIVLGAGAVLIAASPAFALFDLGESEKLIADLGLATIVLCGVFVAVATCHATVIGELRDQTGLALMAKPVRPIILVLGKYVGLAATLAALCLTLTVVLLVTLRGRAAIPVQYFVPILFASLLPLVGSLVASVRWRGLARESWVMLGLLGTIAALLVLTWLAGVRCEAAHHHDHVHPGWRWDVAVAVGLQLVELLVIGAIALALSLRLGLVHVAALTATAFLVGNLANYIHASLVGVVGPAPAGVVRALLPNFDNFHVAEAAALGRCVSAATFGWASLYGLLYATAVLGLGTWALQRRELG